MRRGVWVCVFIAASAHAALLVGPWLPTLDRAALSPSAGTPRRALMTRQLQRSERAPTVLADQRLVSALPPAMGPVRTPVARVETPSPHGDAGPPVAADRTLPELPPADAARPAEDAVSAAEGFETAASEPVIDDPDDRYVPRRILTRAPVALDGVLLTYPRVEFDDGEPHTTILSIFIDELGRVRRIRVDEPGLPEELEGVARRAFQRVRYSPGEVEGQPVPSVIRVEVRFDRLIPATP